MRDWQAATTACSWSNPIRMFLPSSTLSSSYGHSFKNRPSHQDFNVRSQHFHPFLWRRHWLFFKESCRLLHRFLWRNKTANSARNRDAFLTLTEAVLSLNLNRAWAQERRRKLNLNKWRAATRRNVQFNLSGIYRLTFVKTLVHKQSVTSQRIYIWAGCRGSEIKRCWLERFDPFLLLYAKLIASHLAYQHESGLNLLVWLLSRNQVCLPKCWTLYSTCCSWVCSVRLFAW